MVNQSHSQTTNEVRGLLPYLTRRERGEIDRLLTGLAPMFPAFIRQANPRYQFYKHLDNLHGFLQRVAEGDIKRLMVFMPPRHSKSETVSRLFSAYYLLRHPERWVGIASYAEGLAFTLSRNARDNYQRSGGTLSQAAWAVSQWETGKGGGLWAAGVGGGITGKGFHLGIIDDPLKDAEEAQSSTIREKVKDWYSSTFSTRQEPDASIVVIQTRWHEDDLAGWLLSRETDAPEHWHIVDFPAIAEQLPKFPATCTVEADFRQDGAALCPERYPLAELRKIERGIGAYFWASLYQQRPQARTGGLFQRQWFAIVDALPAAMPMVRFYDLAATAQGDWTAGCKAGMKDGVLYLADMRHMRGTPAQVEALIRQTAELDGRAVTIYIEQEPGSSGVNTIDHYQRHVLPGFAVKGIRSTGSKAERAAPVSSAAEAGNVKLLRGAWIGAFLDEAEAFPNGAHDDMVDAVSGAIGKLTTGGWSRGPTG
jgi:predicted phage terminase large subunit-like protein